MLFYRLLYAVSIFFYQAGIVCSSPFSRKAARWIRGRKNWASQLRQSLRPGERRIWVHCASLGEFEQGRPLIEALRKAYPDHTVLLSFFSPSGFESARNYSGADYIRYLPMDGKRRARTFIRLVEPRLAVFVKYEFWYNYLDVLRRRGIPAILIAASFREGQPFFRWYGGLFRKMLQAFETIFVQDPESARLLGRLRLDGQVVVAGDTRYDRVAEIAAQAKPNPVLESFKGRSELLIAGSTWPEDEELLAECISVLPKSWKLVIAPHEIDPPQLMGIRQRFGSTAIYYSEWGPETGGDSRVLVIDNIGMLSGMYRYAGLAWLGGGFRRSGIHNVLEATASGLPVLFGPNYEKFVEAAQLAAQGLAFPVSDLREARIRLGHLVADPAYRLSLKQDLLRFMAEHTGATDRIMQRIQEKAWLSSDFRLRVGNAPKP